MGATGPDLAGLAAHFGARLRAAGLPVGPERCERFARAVLLANPGGTAHLRHCARITLAADRGQIAVLDRVFDEVFAGLTDPADRRGDPTAPDLPHAPAADPNPPARQADRPDGPAAGAPAADPARDGGPDRGPEADLPVLASAAERLAGRDFGDLDPDELLLLADLMGRLRLATPHRRGRRTRPVPHGHGVDLRAALRRAHRTGGDPVRLPRRRPRPRPRRLVALCDISGSMAPYSRAMLQLLYCATGAGRAEVFTFATRLTRVTPALTRSSPDQALAAAGQTAPDWSGGTRIGAALREFIDGYGRRGLARGAVVLIISDGWETGDPEQLGHEMVRLSRLAYRIVWVNPRTQSPRYRPLVGGMAAAWPHCDAVVSAHRLTALDALVTALADPVRRRARPDPR
nr:VWA domain-containing protein [Micromonospora sp. DSM 115978]